MIWVGGRRVSVWLALSAAGLLYVLAGCGSDDGPRVATAGGTVPEATASTGTSEADREAQLRQFAQCMRDNGVDLPDPQPGRGFAGTIGGTGGINPSDPTVQAAFTACRSKLPGGGQPPKLNPQQAEQFRAFAECMRTNGIDVPDPSADGTLQLPRGGLGAINPNDPTFQAALTACRDKLTGLLPSGGPGQTTARGD